MPLTPLRTWNTKHLAACLIEGGYLVEGTPSLAAAHKLIEVGEDGLSEPSRLIVERSLPKAMRKKTSPGPDPPGSGTSIIEPTAARSPIGQTRGPTQEDLAVDPSGS